jgi:uncharacterized protein
MKACRIDVKLKPRASGDRILIDQAGHVAVAVTSPPVDDKANAHLVRLLSEALRIPRSSMSLIRGGHSRNKTIEIRGLTSEEVILGLRNR